MTKEKDEVQKKEEKRVPEASPFASGAEEKPSKKIYFFIGALLVVIIVLIFFLFKGKASDERAASPQLKQMEDTVNTIQKLESEIQEKQNEVFSLVSDYKKKTGKDIAEFNIMNLTPEQKELLQEKIQNEEDTSIKSLLQDIIDKDADLKQLNEKVQELENLLPKPATVEKGQNHYQIAMDFLVNQKGLDKKTAMDLMERAALFEPLVPGFKVWHFYANGEYGTFVTQGSAPISPNQIQRKVKKELVDARDEAIAQRDQLQSDIEMLENRRGELISQLDLLNQEKDRMIATVNELNLKNEELQKNINSVYYVVDIKKNLQDKGILKSGFLRSTKMNDVDPENFDHAVDLRKGNVIQIAAGDHGLDKIRNVQFFPKFYKEEIDYSVVIDEEKLTATVTLINDKKFRSERVVISIQ